MTKCSRSIKTHWAIRRPAFSPTGNMKVYEKDLEDGGRAFGFFNLGEEPVKMDFTGFAQFGLTGRQHVRDLWRQQDLADINVADGVLPLAIPQHGVLLYKLKPVAD